MGEQDYLALISPCHRTAVFLSRCVSHHSMNYVVIDCLTLCAHSFGRRLFSSNPVTKGVCVWILCVLKYRLRTHLREKVREVDREAAGML